MTDTVATASFADNAVANDVTALPDFRVPFNLKALPLVDYFVPRLNDMQQLQSFFLPRAEHPQQRVFVAYGMGGIGKTQLCAQFARQHQNEFSAIFWLDGSSKDALMQAMASAALDVLRAGPAPAPETTTLQPNVPQLVDDFCRWLSQRGNTNWLLIVDNVDREWQSTPVDPQAYDYRQQLPSADHGNVLVTTRILRLQRPDASIHVTGVGDALARRIIESRACRPLDGTHIGQLHCYCYHYN